MDDGEAEADAAEAERAVGASEVDDPGEQVQGETPAAEPVEQPTAEFTREPPTEQFLAQQPTQQFPAQQPTQQFPAQQQAGGWGGVPQGPAASAPAQPQWGTAPPNRDQPAGGYQPAGPQQPTSSYSAAPPPGSGPQFGAPLGSQPQQAGPFGPGDAPQQKSRTPLIVGGIAVAVVLALVIVLAVRLISGGDDEAGGTTASPTAPTSTDPTDDPASADPTDDPASADPTDDPAGADATDAPTAGGSSGDTVARQPGEAGEVLGISGDPEMTVAVISIERNWEAEGSQAVLCGEPDYEYIAVELEFTTLPAMADGTGSYSFAGFELGLATAQGTPLDASGIGGLFCLSQDQRPPSDMTADQTYTGWAVLDASPDAALITWNPFLDVTGQQPVYAWSLEDF
ncbi:hypothetical protein [Ruania albidiflava]|uniref:hypothetical protein n=1 Tax=Ruania albidiflava TaxID=366586 RepID=UPI0023F27264|nr:hypothetical protein [Ruania albidiflava]